jgi:DNA-binding transcriptional LysR family regulator
MDRFTLHGFEVVRSVAELGSFTAAAQALGYTQSAISRQIAAMEAAAGTPLFERGVGGARPTPAGRRVLAYGGGALEQVAALRASLATSSRPVPRLRVGAFPTAFATLVPLAVSRYLHDEPGAKLHMKEGRTASHVRAVRGGRCDIAVIASLPGQPHDLDGLVIEPLMDDPALLATARGHRLAAAAAVTGDDLAGERWIGVEGRESLVSLLPGEPVVSHLLHDWTAKLGLVAAGLGVALVPTVAAAMVREDVVLRRIDGPLPSRSVMAVSAARPQHPDVLRGFKSALSSAVAAARGAAEARIAI